MKNFIFLLILALVCGLAFGAAPQKLRVDQVQIGISGSAGAKDLSFDFGQGANNPKIQNDGTNFSFNQGSDFTGNVDVTGNFSVTGQTTKGNGTDATNLDTYNIGQGAANPYYGYDATLGAMVFRNPGGPVKKMGSGSGGGEGGINIVLNGKAEDGLANWTNSGAGAFTEVYQSTEVLEGEKSFKFDSINIEDAVTSDLVTLNDGLIGTSCEARIYYKGGDANLSFELVNGNGTVLKTQALIPHPIASHESLFFLCPNSTEIAGDANKGKLAVRVRQTTATNAIAITFDNMYLGSLIGLVETTLPDVLSATIDVSGNITSEQGAWISSVSKLGTGLWQINFKPGVFTVPPTSFCAPLTSTSLSYICNPGNAYVDRVEIEVTTNANVNADTQIHVIVTKQGPDAKQTVQVYKSIPKIADNVNEFSAYVSASGSVSYENIDWIDGDCTVSATNQFSCNFKSDLFSFGPTCTYSAQGVLTGARTSTMSQATVSGVSYSTFSVSSGTVTAAALNGVLKCSRGTDFKTPTVQPVIVGQVTNSYAESASKNVRVESCTVNNNGTATLDPTSGLCASWVYSVSRTSTGVVDVTFIPGTFSKKPNCGMTTHGGGLRTGCIDGTTTSINGVKVITGTLDTANNENFVITCQGEK